MTTIKNNKLFIKIFITLLTSILLLTYIYASYSISNQKAEILKSLNFQAHNMAKMLKYFSSDAIVLNDGSAIIELYGEFLSQNAIVLEVVLARTNKESYVIGKENWSFEKKLDKLYLENQSYLENYKIVYSPKFKKEVFLYSYPVVFSQTKWGNLQMILSLDEFSDKIKSMYIQYITFFVLIFIVIVFASYYIAKKFSKPIIELNRVAKKISMGNLQLRSEYKSNDELGELSVSFNDMISKIEESQNDLRKSREDLEVKVKDRTLELYETNKKLKHKTKELKELNVSLDKRIKAELKKREEQEKIIIQQSRLAAMGEMIGNIAHQWRQPLSGITTSASGIKLEKEFGLSTEDREIEKLDTIISTAGFLSKTIDDFSNFFRPNKRKQEFLISDEVDKTLTLVGSSLKFHYIEVEKDFKESKNVYGLPNEFAQVTMNIITNAKDVLILRKIENPKIIIRIYSEGDNGILEIEDNAGGIEEEILSKIFDPYFTTKHQAQGTGIGLYMAKVIVEQNMHGKLEVFNSKEGALFKVNIPSI